MAGPESAPQPSGTVSLLFSDIEGSTALLQRIGPSLYGEVLGRHRELLRAAFAKEGGYEVDCEGDSFFVAFSSAMEALAAAERAQQALHDEPWPPEIDLRVRIGIHTGEPVVEAPKYVGLDVHRAARIMAAAHGGQIVLSSKTCELVPDGQFRDLGVHRLRDFPDPERLYQLGDGSFPPLRTLSATNLPRAASSFVGRRREVGEVTAKLTSGAWLVTLTGPGGAGKTRLALEVAGALVAEYGGGVFWVDLAPVRVPGLVAETIARAIGARGSLSEHIGEREILLVLDNLEQVVDVAPELAELVGACPSLSLLVTSRELLRVSGESPYAVQPLVPADAVTLFCERASHEPGADVEELCARLDNLPLAIELAAARTRALSPAQIVQRLSGLLDLFRAGRDADPRHETLRATIAWSYELLADDERRLLRSLSVFSGGCSIEAAEEICGADIDLLQSLVEKSLVRFTNERYRLLETIRIFAAEELEGLGEADAVRERHMRWYASELARRELALRDDDEEARRFGEAELDNAGVAIAYAIETRSGLEAAWLLWGTFKAWGMFGRIREGARWADAVLDAHLDVAGISRVCLLAGAGGILQAAAGQDLGRTRRLHEEALEAALDLADCVLPGGRTSGSMVISLRSILASLALRAGAVADALAYAEAALREARADGELRVLERGLDAWSMMSFATGDMASALAAAEEQLLIATQLGRVRDACDALTRIAHCQIELGDDHAAAAAVSDAIGRIRVHPTRHGFVGNVFLAAAALAGTQGEPELESAFLRLATKTSEDIDLSLDVDPERALIFARLRKDVAGVESLADFESEDEALDCALQLARRTRAAGGVYG